MGEVKKDVEALLRKLPENCTMEDVQYHLYVIEKVRQGIHRAAHDGSLSHAQVEQRLDRWLTK